MSESGKPDRQKPRGEARPGGGKPRWGKPATGGQGGQGTRGKYARPSFGRPAGKPSGSPGKPPVRGPYGRPAPKGEGNTDAPGAVRDKPAFKRADALPGQGRAPSARPSRPYAPRGVKPGTRPAKDGRAFPSSPAPDGAKRPFNRPSRPGETRGLNPAARPGSGFQRRPAVRPAPRPAAPPQPSLSADARRVALLVLNRVLTDEAYASLTLDEMFRKMRLTQKDKRLAAAIVYRTLENLYRIDFALDQFLKDRSALDPRVLNVLRLSACQILLMDKIPDFAAVNEAVDLTRSLGREELTGLVNGVLRALIRGRETLPWPRPGDDNYHSVTHSLPRWLAEEILEGYPPEVAEAILSYRNPEHAVTLRRNETLVTQAEFDSLLKKKVWQVKDGLLPGVARVTGTSDIGLDADFLAGRFSIQGEGSMLAVLALSPKAGAQVLDCCAAPGGKACYLGERMQNTGRVHAWDVHEHRVELIQAQAQRLRLYNIRPAVRDSAVYLERFEQTMDAVLLDAPCSGTGVMDNKPDVKYRLTPEGLESLLALQESLLDTVCRYVKPGGVLLYATCSLLPRENAVQVERFLNRHPEFQLDALPPAVPEAFIGETGSFGLQLLPHRDGTEGFFIARMRRV